MKKYACLLLFAIMLNGCDDGDLIEETIDFAQVTPESCDTETNELLYKLKEQESLLLQLAPETLKPEVGNQNFDITTDGAYRLVYKAYDGAITKSNICDAIRPSYPNVSNEWFATSGKMRIETTPQIDNNEATGSSSITGFNHAIYMENISYSKPSGDQVDPEFFFGSFVDTKYKSPTVSFTKPVVQCATKQLYNYTSTSSMTIDAVDPILIVNQETSVNSPRESKITDTLNKVVFRTYNGTLTDDYFCNTTLPTSPEIDETWNGANNGIISVATSQIGSTYTHTITLKNVTLVNGKLEFKLGDSFLFGVLTTQ